MEMSVIRQMSPGRALGLGPSAVVTQRVNRIQALNDAAQEPPLGAEIISQLLT